MEDDKRKHNGGSRVGSGKKKLPAGEKKITLSFQIKQKFLPEARQEIQKLVDKINNKKD